MPLIRVHLVTCRRPHVLARAIDSLIRQTESSWVAEVINDDPEDERVRELITRIDDPRLTLSEPSVKRGGTGNFNYAFRHLHEPFATILEDDNWWEPDFLKVMIQSLQRHAGVQLALANEKIWVERHDGSWDDTTDTIWPKSEGISFFGWRVEDKLGSAKLCNSSMVWRTADAAQWHTPDTIPIDVTEHFRERVIPHPVLLVHNPLVNYAVTLKTNRQGPGKSKWGLYQVMLIGSAFAMMDLDQRTRCANILWARARTSEAPLKTSLMTTGLVVPAARILWRHSSFNERCRWLLTLLRRFSETRAALSAPKFPEWRFLLAQAFPADSTRL